MNSGCEHKQHRAILTLTLLFVLSLVAETLTPLAAEAVQEPDVDSAISWIKIDRHQHKNEKKDRSNRRRGVESEVIGGTPVPQGQFRFMAFIIEGGFFHCGGSLIDPSFVLTAAHCVTDEEGNALDPDLFTLVVGKVNVSTFTQSDVRRIAEVIPHPDWDPLTFENDAALLELDTPVPSRVAKPLPIVRSGQTSVDSAGRIAKLAGWGETENGEISSRLLETNLLLVSDGACGAAWGTEFFSSVMLCAAFPSRDSCFGDSGGPLIVKAKVGTKKKKRKKGHRHRKRIPVIRDVQTGIVSFGGLDCADPDFPGIYTRLTAPGINDFIVDVVNP